MKNSNTKLVWKKNVQKELQKMPNKVVEIVARETLNRTYPTIPMSSALNRNVNRGRLRRETIAKGVQKNSNTYYLESPTYYSNYVYNMNNTTTNWSTPGTKSQWFSETWNKEGKSIFAKTIERNKL